MLLPVLTLRNQRDCLPHSPTTLRGAVYRPTVVKRDLQRSTPLNISHADARLHQLQDEQDEYQDQYRHYQQVAEREPGATVPGHTLSFRYLLP